MDVSKAAREVMQAVNPACVTSFLIIVDYLHQHPDSKKSASLADNDGLLALAKSYAKARQPNKPRPPATVPDELVSFILNAYFKIEQSALQRIQKEHQLSMSAENMVGDLLERYLATLFEPRGWAWCAGSVIRAVDFVRPPAGAGDEWQLLQIKNRDNSENSSSKSVRDGTNIMHWHRSFSKTGGTNWHAFPDSDLDISPSEDGFREFARDYLARLRS